MSIALFMVLCGMMVANQIIGIANGWYREGFSLRKMVAGFQKYGIILFGYGMIAAASYVLGNYFPKAEIISGILLDPIAKYFVKLLNRLRNVVSDNIEDVLDYRRFAKDAKATMKGNQNLNALNGYEVTAELEAGIDKTAVGQKKRTAPISRMKKD